MVRQLLPDVPRTIFRPSIVLGDSRRPETNQFDMVRAFVFLAGLPALPFRPTDRIDIVPVDFVADSVVTLHQKQNPDTRFITRVRSRLGNVRGTDRSLAKAQGKRAPIFVPSLERPSAKMVNALAGSAGKVGGLATLLKVFLPYLVWNTVFDNSRIVAEMGRRPAPFSQYCYPLLRFTRENNFAYKYRSWPSGATAQDCPGRCSTMDFVLEAWVSGMIELNKLEWMLGAGTAWKAGSKLKLLFAGYNGTRNTGSDVRVEEIARQLRRILGLTISNSA